MDITNKFTNKNSEKVKIQLDLNASASEEETLSDHYVILRSLGKGDFAEVKLAYHLHTEVQVAVKVLENGTKNEFSRKTKIDMYNTLNHPYIIKLFHIINNKEYIYVVLEHAAGGDLVSYTGRMGSLQEEQAQHIFTQLVCAVHYCHDNGIAHRDIKLDNILLDAKGNNKLCDFGLATRVTPGQGTKGFCGTLEYCAPEFFSGKEYDAKAVDIWSMGVFLYTMVTASFPFKANTYSDMKEEMLDPKYHLPYTLSQNIANILVQLFTVKPEHRPKIFDMRQHQWLKTKEKFGKITPSLQALWNNLNPCIVVAMGRMDYHPKDISACLREKKFNNIMAIYLILNHKSPCDLYKYAAKFLPARVTMSPADALTSFPTQRGLSEPALLNLLEEHQMHDEKGSRKKRMSIPPACAASIWETNILPQPPNLLLFTVKPEQRPKIFDMRQHQWLKMKGEFGKITPSLEALWNNLNPSIVVAMGRMGYHPIDITACLHEKKFNNIISTYLILNHKSPCDHYKYAAKFLPARVTMSPGNALTSFPTQRGLSGFAIPILLEEHQMHDEKGLRKKRIISLSMPASLCCQQMGNTHPPPAAKHVRKINYVKSRCLALDGMISNCSSSRSLSSESTSFASSFSCETPQEGNTPNNSSDTQSSGSYRVVPQFVNTTATYDIQRASLQTTSKDSYGDVPPEGIPHFQR
ncbi:hypothetical protein NN561_017257 [Cricetulus griseus]